MNVDVCPLRPSGYYTPTDGALPFIAHTFCEFSHFPPEKTPFLCRCESECSAAYSCLGSDEEQIERKRRGRGEKAEAALSFWEVMSNDIST